MCWTLESSTTKCAGCVYVLHSAISKNWLRQVMNINHNRLSRPQHYVILFWLTDSRMKFIVHDARCVHKIDNLDETSVESFTTVQIYFMNGCDTITRVRIIRLYSPNANHVLNCILNIIGLITPHALLVSHSLTVMYIHHPSLTLLENGDLIHFTFNLRNMSAAVNNVLSGLM